MHRQKQNQQYTRYDSVLGQQLQIVVMHVNRIDLHPVGSKLPAIIEIRAAACTEHRLQMPLLGGGLPKIEPDIADIEDVVGAFTQHVVALNKKHYGSGQQQRQQSTRDCEGPE